jgi:glutamine amidotransferase
MVLLLDLEFCNIKSVELAFERIGVSVTLGSSRSDIDAADIVVLPGVGSFKTAMARLNDTGLPEALRRHALERRRPLVGICLGMQLLADASTEHGRHQGLGIIPGVVRKLTSSGAGDRVPNMGWSDLAIPRENPFIPRMFDGEAAYFAHSYHFIPEDDGDVVATITHGDGPVTAVVARGRIIGMQFHPEKSLDVGLEILKAVMDAPAMRGDVEQTP